MKYFFLLMLIPTFTFADVITECGEYTARGIVRGGQGISIIINEKTQSEYTLTMPVELMATIGSYIDGAVTAKIVMDKKLTPVKGHVSKIEKIERRVPNPLNPEDTGMLLIKKTSCQN